MSRKHRKRKRKHMVHDTQHKKCKHTHSSPPLNDHSLPDIPDFPQTALFCGGAEGSNLGKATPASNANKSANGSKQNIERNEENDYESKAMTINGNDTDKLAIQIPHYKKVDAAIKKRKKEKTQISWITKSQREDKMNGHDGAYLLTLDFS